MNGNFATQEIPGMSPSFSPRSHVAALGGAVLSMLPSMATAQLTGQVGLTSNRVWHGSSQTCERPAIQAELPGRDAGPPNSFEARPTLHGNRLPRLKDVSRHGGRPRGVRAASLFSKIIHGAAARHFPIKVNHESHYRIDIDRNVCIFALRTDQA